MTPQSSQIILYGHDEQTESLLQSALQTLHLPVHVYRDVTESLVQSVSNNPSVVIARLDDDIIGLYTSLRHAMGLMIAVNEADDVAGFQMALDSRMDAIIEKPLNPNTLSYRLHHIIDRWRHVNATRKLARQMRETSDSSAYSLFVHVQDQTGGGSGTGVSDAPESLIRLIWAEGESIYDDAQVLMPIEILEMSQRYELVHESDRESVRLSDQQALSGHPQSIEYRFINRDGLPVWVRKTNHIEPVSNGYYLFVMLENLKNDVDPKIGHDNMLSIMYSTASTLSSTLEFSEVLDRILDSAAVVIPYEYADVMLVNNDGIAKIVRHKGYEEFDVDLELVDNFTLDVKENAILQAMAKDNIPMRVTDVTRDPRYQLPDSLPMVRSYLGIPMYVGDRLAGFLNFNHTKPDWFTEAHLDYAAIISTQISVAISNAQLYDIVTRHSVELEERIRDLILIHDIGKELQSSLDVDQVYHITYENVVNFLFPGARLDVYLYDRANKRLIPAYSIDEGEERDVSEMPYIDLQEGASGTQADIENGVLLEAIQSAEMMVTDGVLYQPLVTKTHVTGVLKISNVSVASVDEVRSTLMSTVISQAAIAIENAQLYATVQEQISELTSLYVATTALFSAEDFKVLGQEITDAIVEQFDQPHCALYLVNEDLTSLECISQSGPFAMDVAPIMSLNEHDPILECLNMGSIVYVPDTRKNAFYNADESLTRSKIIVPLNTRNGPIGVLDLQSPEVDDFDDRDSRVLQAFGERVASALENRMLYDRIRQYADTLEQRVQERTEKLRESLSREREINDMKTRFIQNVSHQFRTPLTAILTAGQMLERYSNRMSDADRTIRYETIRRAVSEIENLLNDSVSVSEATEGLLEFDPVAIDLQVVSQSVIDDLMHYDQDFEHHITLNVDGDCSLVMVDVRLWQRIIKELVLNAAKYSRSDQEISCTIECNDDDIQLIVADSGVGIPEGDLPYVFDMFHRGANVSNIYGSGLGLSIVIRAVEMHSGTIDIDSKVNKGTKVMVKIPKYFTKVK